MIKIIDGLRYNTETATKIGEWGNGLYTSDFRWQCESLYVTKKGRYFLVGEGGPATHYSYSPDGNSRCGGEELHVLTFNDARIWCEDHDQDAIESHEPFKSLIREA